MRRLILLRHAKAQRAAAGMDDFERPLTADGRTDAAIIGKVLANEGLTPDRALVSTARRARETFEEAAKSFGGLKGEERRDLYLADGHTLLAAINEAEDADTVLVVAHNPGIHALAIALLRRDSAPASVVAKLEKGYPTATASVFAIDAAGRASYDGLFKVADHGGGGRE